MLKPRRKVSKRQEMRQDTVVTLYARALQFYEQYKKPLIGGGIAIVVLVVGFIGYRAYLNAQNEQAQEQLGEIIWLYEQGDYQRALEGTSEATGLLEIIAEYGSTETGNLARFYAADAFYHLGSYERAVELFEAYDEEDNYLGASAYAGLAASYANLEQFAKAATYYEQAAFVYQNEATSPLYLFSAAQNYEEAGQFAHARELYQRIQEQYPESPQAERVPLRLARLNAQTE